MNSRPDSPTAWALRLSANGSYVFALQSPDLNFPALVAHPVFRPVKLTDEDTLQRMGPLGLVSNGAFMLAKSEADRVLLERAGNYWDKNEVDLEHVEFVGAQEF